MESPTTPRAAQGAEREHLKVAEGHRDVHAGGRLDLVDLALPLGRHRGTDIDEPARAFDSMCQVP
ncbi:MAG: hypothetical protein E6J51_11375 [Chloroflexi bacterium]|nr:MAG: hypothetical protein E6J51_11375 [Chloroflexota bacterium]